MSKIFDKTFKKVCNLHGISHLWYNKCKECEFDKKNPQLNKQYLTNLIRKY